MYNMPGPLYFVISFILLIFSAFFSAADMVYGLVDQNKLEKDIKKGNKAALRASKLAENYELTISTILFGNNLVNILASSIIAMIGLMVDPTNGPTIAAFIFTIILIIVGEFLPKAFAKRFNYTLAKVFAYPVSFFVILFFIVTWPVSKLFKLFVKLFSKKAKEEDEITDKVLDEMLDEIEHSGELTSKSADIIREAIDLFDIEAYEIMTPRVEVFAIDIDDPIEEILAKEELLDYSRVPVYKETIDNIVGILPIKVLSRALLKGEKIDIEKMMYKPIKVPHNHQIVDLLDEFKESLIHIAVVIDEYGGTEGIITMEDILEEVVGEIYDETDDIEETVSIPRKGTYIVDGGMNLEDVFELIDYNEVVDTSYSTIGGFCQEYINRFVKPGDKFKFAHYKIKIIDADEFTAKKIQIRDLNYNKKRV